MRCSKPFNSRLQTLPCFDRPGGEQTPKSVVYGLFKILLATEISLRREDRRVP